MNHVAANPALAEQLPLVLDLDGTVLKTDLLLESLLNVVKRRPACLLLAVGWLVEGRAVLKQQAARRSTLRVDLLPLNEMVIAYAARRHAEGCPVHIATAADASLARRVADRIGFVRDVLATEDGVNLKADAKAQALVARFPGGFCYVGDSWADLAVWRVATRGVFAGHSRRLEAASAKVVHLTASLRRSGPALGCWLRALRIHQWSKNTLVFVPMFLHGLAGDTFPWIAAALGFLAIGLLSSSTYLINDLCDLEDDRRHWSKKDRPLASGALPISHAMIAAPLGIAAGAGLAWMTGGLSALACMLVYLAGSLAYSLGVKRFPIVDVMVIGGLFTLRLVFGAVLVHAPLKPWLFVFSAFLFTSLALAKRSSEVRRLQDLGGERVSGRGYRISDAPLVFGLGVGSSVAAILVMVLYLINEALLQPFYRMPQALFAAPVALTLWLGRIWLLCGRDELDDDPVAFAVRDKPSLWLAATVAVAMIAAVLL